MTVGMGTLLYFVVLQDLPKVVDMALPYWLKSEAALGCC